MCDDKTSYTLKCPGWFIKELSLFTRQIQSVRLYGMGRFVCSD